MASPFRAPMRPFRYMTDAPLYERLGGYDAIARLVDDFLSRMVNDAGLARFFVHVSNDNKVKARQLTLDFICQAAGGPVLYLGRTMERSHRGMGVSGKDWQRTLALLEESLAAFHIPSGESREFYGIIAGLEAAIVDREDA